MHCQLIGFISIYTRIFIFSINAESNLKEGLYHDFKKYGRIKTIQFHDQGSIRHAVVVYEKTNSAEKALNECKVFV